MQARALGLTASQLVNTIYLNPVQVASHIIDLFAIAPTGLVITSWPYFLLGQAFCCGNELTLTGVHDTKGVSGLPLLLFTVGYPYCTSEGKCHVTMLMQCPTASYEQSFLPHVHFGQ